MVSARKVYTNKKPRPAMLPRKLVAVFAIIPTGIGSDDSVWVEKSSNCIGKIEAPLPETGFAFSLVPFKFHTLQSSSLNHFCQAAFAPLALGAQKGSLSETLSSA